MPNVEDPEDFLMSQDIIFVGGGSVANMVAVWRVHGIDEILRKAWHAGIVLAGSSAGGICWFEGGTTDSFGARLRPYTDGLGMLAGSFCPHYHSEAERRPLYQRLVAEGALPGGLACDDGVGAHYVDDALAEMVSDRPDGDAYRVEPDGDGRLHRDRAPGPLPRRVTSRGRRACRGGRWRTLPLVTALSRRRRGTSCAGSTADVRGDWFYLRVRRPVQGPGQGGEGDDREQPPRVHLGHVGQERGERQAGHDRAATCQSSPTMKSYQNAPNDLSCFMSRRPPIAWRARCR